jgi:hypothetical protein
VLTTRSLFFIFSSYSHISCVLSMLLLVAPMFVRAEFYYLEWTEMTELTLVWMMFLFVLNAVL